MMSRKMMDKVLLAVLVSAVIGLAVSATLLFASATGSLTQVADLDVTVTGVYHWMGYDWISDYAIETKVGNYHETLPLAFLIAWADSDVEPLALWWKDDLSFTITVKEGGKTIRNHTVMANRSVSDQDAFGSEDGLVTTFTDLVAGKTYTIEVKSGVPFTNDAYGLFDKTHTISCFVSI